MPDSGPAFTVKLAETRAELRAAQALRYEVFVRELGGGGSQIDHVRGLECDEFDSFAGHLLLTDVAAGRLAGVYRLLRGDQAQAAGRFYSEDEYDLTLLKQSGRRLLELGRSCLHRDYRGGMAMFHLWNGLSDYAAAHGIEILFGTASFHGTDIAALAAPLTLLHANHLAPPELRVRVVERHYQSMALADPATLDRKAAILRVPALIKAYLRLGGVVGDGAFVDRNFNTTDVCLILDTARMNARQRRLYTGDAGE